MIPGYKRFSQPPPARPARIASVSAPESDKYTEDAPNSRNSRNSRKAPGEKPHFERDPVDVAERAAIHEVDGELPLDRAQRLAAETCDRHRPPYPGDAAQAYRDYESYIHAYSGGADDDLPAVPPNVNGRGDLWSMWWGAVEKRNHEQG